MSGRLAIDFGTSNTVISLWDEEKKEGIPVSIAGLSREYSQGTEKIPVIPSLIHYAADNRRWLGDQIFQKELQKSPSTFRWMKRYISNRSPIKINVNGNEITPYHAGKDFLLAILSLVKEEYAIQDEEIGFSSPVEAFEHYENWLSTVALQAGINRFRLIDEPSAAALGYGAHIQPGNVYLLFDFGGGTMHASIALIEEEKNAAYGRHCRILGKSGKDIGGSTLDRWLYEDFLAINHQLDSNPAVRRISNALLLECEEIKETLSREDTADFSIIDPETDDCLSVKYSRRMFEDLLDRHDLFSEINQLLHSAINASRERGYGEGAISSVLAVGGSSQIPSVQRCLRHFFGKDKVLTHRPFDAVARGTAAFIAGQEIFDHIQHDYAIRHYNPITCSYEFEIIVPKFTPYPSHQPIKKLSIKASRVGQKQLGVDIFEFGESHNQVKDSFEFIFDPAGSACIRPVSLETQNQRARFWMNEQNRTFISADPFGLHGERRFDIEFSIDINKRLLITVTDILTSKIMFKDFPVVKLS